MLENSGEEVDSERIQSESGVLKKMCSLLDIRYGL